MLADVTLTTEAVSVVSVMIGGLIAAIVAMFWLIIEGYKTTMKDLKADRDYWRALNIDLKQKYGTPKDD